jgi:dTDP-4-amino-4,6-dideoxygalactose transaminase
VVVPSLTFVATANAVRYTGATPVFADIAGVERPWISAEAVAAQIGPRTRAIMNMTYGGNPGESAELLELAAERGLVLLEDAAHGLGGKLEDRHLGTFGIGGAFSFFSNKNLPVGEGGMVVTDDEDFAAQVRLLRSHGMTSLTWDRHRGHASGYDVVKLGFNYRIDEPRAALATARLERLDSDNAKRTAAVATYRGRIAEMDSVTATMPDPPDSTPAHHLFTVLLDEGIDRDGTRERLAGEGIQTSLHYPPVHSFFEYEVDADVPLTDDYSLRSITLPLFPGITEEQLGLVLGSLEEAVKHR